MTYFSQSDAGLRAFPQISGGFRPRTAENPITAALLSLAGAVGAIDIVAIVEAPRNAKPLLIHLGNECADAGITADTIAFMLHRQRRIGDSNMTRWLESDECDPSYDVLAAAIDLPGGKNFAVGLLFAAGNDVTRARFMKSWAAHATLFGPLLVLCERASQVEQELSGYQAALDQCASAIVLLDRDGEIIRENGHARGLLAAGNGLQRRGRSVVATELADAAKLRVAIDHVIADSDRSVPLLAIRRSGGLPRLLVSVVGTSAQDNESRRAFAVLFICDPARDSTNLLSALCRLYGLSPVETALACQIVSGVPLCDAAAVLRIRELTARGYLKQIFAKTGVNRQASFVSLMLSSSIDVKNECDFAVL